MIRHLYLIIELPNHICYFSIEYLLYYLQERRKERKKERKKEERTKKALYDLDTKEPGAEVFEDL